jgi:hypothetical protein
MPKNDNRKDKDSPTPVQESRVDLSSPEWEKRSRVDFAGSDQPLPVSPLVALEPHSPSDKDSKQASGTNQSKSEE